MSTQKVLVVMQCAKHEADCPVAIHLEAEEATKDAVLRNGDFYQTYHVVEERAVETGKRLGIVDLGKLRKIITDNCDAMVKNVPCVLGKPYCEYDWGLSCADCVIKHISDTEALTALPTEEELVDPCGYCGSHSHEQEYCPSKLLRDGGWENDQYRALYCLANMDEMAQRNGGLLLNVVGARAAFRTLGFEFDEHGGDPI